MRMEKVGLQKFLCNIHTYTAL